MGPYRVFLSLTAAMLLLILGESQSSVIVDTPSTGQIRADLVNHSSHIWIRARGIQYAEHPTGDLRWQPPMLHKKSRLNGVVSDATSFGPDCINAPLLERIISIGTSTMAEGCLYLNVYAPYPFSKENAPRAMPPYRELLPVLFYIHGGSWAFGGSSAFDGDRILSVHNDSLIVTANYRLGALGFMGGRAVAGSSRDGSAGNFGLQDTRAALEWVQHNIRSFGGDPSRVTIMGESAGASLVACHLVAPRSRGLFHGAIMESGAFDNYTVQVDPNGYFERFADLAGCNSNRTGNDAAVMLCLRQKPLRSVLGEGLMDAIRNTSSDAIFTNTVDGVELTATPEVLAANGGIVQVESVLLGTNLNEARLLMPVYMPIPNAPESSLEDLKAWLHSNYQFVSPGVILEEYSDDLTQLADTASGHLYWELGAKIFTDSQYLCPTERSAAWIHQSNAAKKGVYVYRMTYEPVAYFALGLALDWYDWCSTWLPCDNMTEPIGASHGADVPLLWNSKQLVDAPDHEVSKNMIQYWHNFLQRSDPNSDLDSVSHTLSDAAHLPVWPRYDGKSNASMELNLHPAAKSFFSRGHCSFWSRVHPVPYD